MVSKNQVYSLYIKGNLSFSVQNNSSDHSQNTNLIKLIKLEHSILLEQGEFVPAVLESKHIEELLLCISKQQRKNTMIHFADRQRKKEISKLKAKTNQTKFDESYQGLFHSKRFFYRVQKKTMLNSCKFSAMQSFRFNKPLIFDFSFNKNMVLKEQKVLVEQILAIKNFNYSLVEPFPLHFYNYDYGNFFHHNFSKKTDLNEEPIVVNENDFIDDYSHQKLCYISPHSKKYMREFDPDTTYVIPAFIDLSGKGNIVYGKSLQHNIPSVRLPVDR